jgi:hypothetical protein
MYIAYDPGKMTGWASFDDDGKVIAMGQVTIEELIDQVEVLVNSRLALPIKAVIYEDFIIFKHKAKFLTGSRVEASQAIGIIKGLAQRTGAELIMQGSDIKPMAQKFTQIFPPSDHAESHKIDAFNHGAYYLINKGIRKTALEEEVERAK